MIIKNACNAFLLLLLTHCSLVAQIDFESFEHNDITRQYIVHTPPDFDVAQSLPLVINMHGNGSNAGQQIFYSQMNNVADTSNFVVVYPDGIDNAWNIAGGGGVNESIDDVDFLSQLIDTLHINYNIDLNRVYSTGMSLGGFMTFRLACQLDNKVAAFASVTGSMSNGLFDECTPSRPLPILQIHGTDDDTVPYDGSIFGASMDEIVDFWTTANNCDDMPTTTDLPDIDPADGSTISIIDYNNCDNNGRMTLYRIDGGTHTWAGSALDLGGTNYDIHASREIWNFFKNYTLDGSPVVGINDNLPSLSEKATIYFVAPQQTLHLQNLPTNAQILYIYNARGQLVYEQQWLSTDVNSELSLRLPSLNKGMYFVQLLTDTKILQTEKILF